MVKLEELNSNELNSETNAASLSEEAGDSLISETKAASQEAGDEKLEEKKESTESVLAPASFHGLTNKASSSGTSKTDVAVRKFMLGDSDLNNDVFWEIGSAMSIERRLKMKRISSEWMKFIESSRFASPTWIAVYNLKEGLCRMFDEGLTNVTKTKFLPYTLPVGCAGGLLLFKAMEGGGYTLKRACSFSRIFIWNPIMELALQLIPPQAAKREPATVSYGFGFGEGYGYKIVQLSQNGGRTECWVYSSPFEDWNWKAVESEILNQDGEIALTEYAVRVDDTLFWAIYPEARDLFPKPWIWAYKLSEDSLTKIEIPSSAELFYRRNFLGVLKNRLSYTNCDCSFRTESGAVDIWLFEEMKWEKHYTIQTWFGKPGDYATIYKVVHLLNNGNLAILTETQYNESDFDHHLISYNPTDESYETVTSFVSRTEAMVMVPNILPLNKIDGIKGVGMLDRNLPPVDSEESESVGMLDRNLPPVDSEESEGSEFEVKRDKGKGKVV